MAHVQRPRRFGEYVALMASMMSLVALSIDAMLPALFEISRDLNAKGENDRQLVITTLFLGMALGNLVYGPVSDSYGRKRPIYAGYTFFIIGSIVSALAGSFAVMLLGRFVQGIGAAAPRIITVAIIRDQYQGRTMARIMSLVMMVFIMVPALAPAIGQGLMTLAGWRSIYWFFVLLSIITLVWFWLMQPETLAERKRKPFSIDVIGSTFVTVIGNPVAMGYTVAAGLVFGAFIGYLNSSQQILQELYGLGKQFPLYFGMLAVVIGLASYANSRLVVIYGMQRLCLWALIALTVLSVAFMLLLLKSAPTLLWLMIFLSLSFFAIGILFGNFNALAMEPLGEVAGMGSSVTGFISVLVALLLGYLIGDRYDNTVMPLVVGFLVLSVLSLILMLFLIRIRTPGSVQH